jgi:soluble lytic murein transglycosylase-like protein
VGIRTFHHIGPVVAALLSVLPSHAAEFAILTNGFRIQADKHEVEGDRVKLYTAGGVTEVAASEIASFEPDDAPPSPPAPPAQTPPPAIAPVPKDIYTAAAEKHGLPVALVKSVVKAESNFQPNAISPKGAIGLMQLMPGTARDLGVDPADPAQNVEAGTRYLRDLLIKYEGSPDQVARAIAAYNAGPAAVDKYNGVPPYAETQLYVLRVLREYLKNEN